MTAWSTSLPQKLLIEGYGESVADVSIKSQMDVGPAKVRRRTSAAIRPVAGKMLMNSTQLSAFKTFYNTDLLGGSLRFSWVDPIFSTSTCEMRFTDPPSWSAIDFNTFEVNMNLEILP
jgi:hypothetical protein